MALIKGNKDKEEAVQSSPLIKKTSVYRSADFAPGTFKDRPEAGEEGSNEPFHEGLPVPAAAANGKVLGGRTHTTIAPGAPLPLRQTVVISTGGRDAAPESQNHHQAPPQMMSQTEVHHAPPQPVYNAGPPVDQAIIEEAQKRANQILQEAQGAANQMLMEYQTQAQQMMEQANQQIQAHAEQVQRQAHEAGLQQGYQEGIKSGGEAALQQVHQMIHQVRDLYVQAVKQRQWLMQSVEPELARLSVKVAEKILGQEVRTQPDAIIGIVKAALAGVGDREEVTIRVHPEDFEVAHQQKSVFERMVEGLKKFEIVADQAIDQGGCSIETNLGNVDARLVTQITTLRNALEEAAKTHEAEIKEEIELQAQRMQNVEPGPGGEG